MFLIEDFLLRYEKKRSPICALSDITNPKKTLIDKLISKNKSNKKILTKIEKKNDPKLPEIVLFGLMVVSFGPLKIFPKVIPPISDAIQTSKIIYNIILK